VWKNQFQALAEAGFHVIAPDLRGYNTSSKPLGVTSYARQPVLSDIVCIIDHFGAGKRAIVVSLSPDNLWILFISCPDTWFSLQILGLSESFLCVHLASLQ
jgi:alpha-beta hydrolase superfamily lysophospholipase